MKKDMSAQVAWNGFKSKVRSHHEVTMWVLKCSQGGLAWFSG